MREDLPANALFKRRDGSSICTATRASAAAPAWSRAPTSAVHRSEHAHAEKCNFCANRVENDLLPLRERVPHRVPHLRRSRRPASEVALIAQRAATSVRKPEKGTIPKVFYIGADDSVLQPEIATRPFVYKEGQVLLRPLGSPTADPSRPGDARVDYDTPHEQPWGLDMALYLLTKGIATGALLLTAILWWLGDHSVTTRLVGPAISLVFIVATALLLIGDLERPERFYYILVRPNHRSWMVWGAYFLTAHGAISALWIAAAWLGGRVL